VKCFRVRPVSHGSVQRYVRQRTEPAGIFPYAVFKASPRGIGKTLETESLFLPTKEIQS
jgi:hypothetical protein